MSEQKISLTPELKAIMVLFVFVIFGPIIQMTAYILVLQNWAASDNFVATFWHVVRVKVLPALLPAYGQYMPSCFIAGWLLRSKMAKNLGFSFQQTMVIMLLASLGIEALIQVLSFVFGAPFYLDMSIKMFWLTTIQALVSGLLCWLICHRLTIDRKNS